MREEVLAVIPDAVPALIKPLLELGMIDGWRSVVGVNIPRDLPHLVSGPFLTGFESCRTKKGVTDEPA